MSINMDCEREIRVMNEYKPFLRILKAFDRGNFHIRNSGIQFKNVFFTFCVTCVLFCHISIVIAIFWSFFDDKFKLKKIVPAVPYATSGILIVLTLSSLVLRSDKIGTTFNHIQQLVDKREIFFKIITLFIALLKFIPLFIAFLKFITLSPYTYIFEYFRFYFRNKWVS